MNWTPARVLATLIVGVVIAIVGCELMFERHSAPRNLVLPGAAVSDGAAVLPDFEIETLDGNAFRLSDFGGKVVVLDFWATWCPPCREEVPQLARIMKEGSDRGVEVIGLHIDDRGRSSSDDIRRFIRTYGVNYRVGLATDEVFAAYLGGQETAIPQTLVFDRSGKLVEHLIGYTRRDASRLDLAVNQALAQR